MRYFILLFLLTPKPSLGETMINPWTGLNIQKSLNPQTTFLWENQYRITEGSFSELQWRVGLIYTLNPKWSIGGGAFYAFNSDLQTQEFRPWQQAIYNQNLTEQLNLVIRYRQEQRYFSLVKEWAHRSRFLVRLNYKVNELTPFVTTEFMVGLTESDSANFPKGYNQNRSQIGLNYKFNAQFSWESSVMRVYTQGVKKDTVLPVWWNSFQFRF